MGDTKYLESLISLFSKIADDPLGGVTRLGYTTAEDDMHNLFIEIANEHGFLHKIDEVGNTYIGDINAKKYVLIGSHLDSVNQGGFYDGVAGIIGGLQVLLWAKENSVDTQIQVVAFRCEESSNFSKATMGSEFITGVSSPLSMKDKESQEKITLGDIFAHRGYSLEPKKIKNVLEYLELHIEQSIVLEKEEKQIGIVSTIAGPCRFSVTLKGQADHSGGTPMMMRKDALAAAAEIILATEKIGQKESVYHTVTTVGVILSRPNVMNVIPGHVVIKVDIRGIDNNSIDRTVENFKKQIEIITKRRKIKEKTEFLGRSLPVKMSDEIQKGLKNASLKLGYSTRTIVSGAGHDAMNFSNICPVGMVFIPCKGGISHSKEEYTSPEDIYRGSRVIYEYLKERKAYDFN